MTQEEKAKAYDDALSVAKEIHSYSRDITEIKRMEQLFPELVESEDERIRKELIKYLKEGVEGYIPAGDRSDYQRWLTWLEKQGVQKEYTFKSLPRLLDMIEPTKRAKAYCQKLIDSLLQEGYTTDAKIVSDCLKQMNGEKVAMATMDEQKSTLCEQYIPSKEIILNVWELGNIWKEITKGVCNTEHGTQLEFIIKHWNEGEHYTEWLEKQGKSKWTEEDEERLQYCISSLQGKGLMGGVDTINTKWLKSLKERIGG